MKGSLRKHLKKGMVVFAAASIVLSGCSATQVDKALQAEKQTPVKVTTISKSSLKVSKEIVGTVKPDVNVSIMPKMAGELVSLHVKKGDQVQKGQVLAKIDDRDLRTTVELQQAALDAQKAALNIAKSNEKSAKTTVEAGAANALAAASIAWADAKENLERIKSLYDAGAVPKVDYEAAVTAEKNAKLKYEQTLLDSDKAGIEVEKSEINVQSSAAQVRQTEMNLKQAQDRVKDAVIIATQSGEVVAVNAEVGDSVGPQSSVFTIVDLDPIKIESTISAGQLALFKKGQSVNVSLPVLNKEATGTISFISSVANQSGLYVIEATISNKDKSIKPGMIGEIVLDQILVEEALLVPTAAIVEQGGVSKIFIVQDGKAVEKQIEVIESQTDFTAINGDVSEGNQVVIKGQNTLLDGNLVNIIEEGK